jgi:hypothetical protein
MTGQIVTVDEDLLNAAREIGAKAATGTWLPHDMGTVAVRLRLIDYETYQVMVACHSAFEQAMASEDARRVRRLTVATMKRKMTALGRQDHLDGRVRVRQERELAEHFGLTDSCTLDEAADYHGAYLAGFNDARAGRSDP